MDAPRLPAALRTRRLHLRAPRPGDGARVHAAVLESLDALRAWPASLPWALGEPSETVSEAFCRSAHDDFARSRSFTYLGFDPSGDVVACASLHDIAWDVPRFELGYWVRAARHRQGYSSEVAQALVGLALDTLQARRVVCFTDAANGPSRRVCTRAGFTREGVMRHHRATPSGDLRDTCVYAIVR